MALDPGGDHQPLGQNLQLGPVARFARLERPPLASWLAA